MYSRVNAHRLFVGVFIGDLVIHVKQVAIFGGYGILTQTLNRFGKVKINGDTLSRLHPGLHRLFP